MIIFFIIGIIISLFAFVNRQKAFIAFLCYRLFLNINIGLRFGGLPFIPLDFVIICIFIFLYFIKKDYKHTNYPLWRPTLFFIVIDIISALFAIHGFFRCLPITLIHICDLLVILFIWIYVPLKSYKALLWGLIFISIVSSIYGFFERATESNPLILYETIMGAMDEDSWMNKIHYGERGYRIQSIFSHPIGAGANFGFLAFLFLYTWKYFKNKTICFSTLLIISGLLCCICVVFSNCRSALVYMLVATIPLFDIRAKKTFLLLSVFLLCVMIFGNYFESYIQNFTGLIDFNNNQNMSGSSVSMRMDQFDAAFQIWLSNPITGLGTRGYEYFSDQGLADRLLGLESIWISLLVEKGFLGLIAYIYFIKCCFKIRTDKKTHKVLFWLMLALVLLETITSLPGAYIYIHFITIFLLLKRYNYLKCKTKQNQNNVIHNSNTCI